LLIDMPQCPNIMNLLDLILLISIPGAFGGLVAGLIEIDKEENGKIAWKLVSRSLIGIAGAFGVVLLGFFVGKVSADVKVLNKLFLISFSLVGGTISYRLLPRIGTKLEEQLQLKIEETKKEVADVVDKKSAETRSYTAAIASAEAALARDVTADVELAIEMLTHLKKKFPIDRTLHIKLGVLFKKLEDYDKAVLTLRDFISELDKEHSSIRKNPHYKHDTADAYFNISCYLVLKAEKLDKSKGNEVEINRLIQKAIEALETSIDLRPENLVDAKKDRELDFIKGREDYKKLIETKSA